MLGEPAVTALRYHRLSDDKGADAKQDGRTRRLCERVGAVIAGTFSDDEITAAYDPVVDDKPPPRRGFEDLLAEVERLRPAVLSGAIARLYVVTRVPSRLTRNAYDYARFESTAARSRVVVLTERRRFDMTDSADRSALMRQADDDANYVAAMSEGLSSALADRRDEGRPRFGGVRPYGFAADRMTPKPDEAAAIRWLAERVLAGDTLAKLARDLNERGVPTPAVATANRARLDKRKRSLDGKQWASATIRQLLRRPSTAGLLAHKGEVVGTFAAVESGEVEPILSREVWQRVGEKLDMLPRGASARQRPASDGLYWLTGLLVCGAPGCAGRLYGGRLSTGSKGKGERARSYRCEHACVGVRADDWKRGDEAWLGIESVAREIVLDLGSDAERMHEIAEAVEERSAEWRKLYDRELELERDLDQLATGVDEDGNRLTLSLANRRSVAVERDLAKVKRERRKLDPTPADALERLQAEARDNLAAAWAVASSDQKRAMLARVVGGIRVMPVGRGSLTRPAERVELIERH